MAFLENLPPIATHLVALLVGVFIGAASQYFGAQFTDQRRKSEDALTARKRFRELEALMPSLIAEMRADLSNPASALSREFFPHNSRAIYLPEPGSLFYDPDVHRDLARMLMILENNGYIVNVSTTETARYRMSEDFVALIKQS